MCKEDILSLHVNTMREEGYKFKYGRVLSCVIVTKREFGLKQWFLHTFKSVRLEVKTTWMKQQIWNTNGILTAEKLVPTDTARQRPDTDAGC